MTGVKLGASARLGDDGLEPAGVVDFEATSPPSPSLLMAESSTNRYFLLPRSTTRMNVFESGEKRKKIAKKNSLVLVEWLGRNVRAKRKKTRNDASKTSSQEDVEESGSKIESTNHSHAPALTMLQ